MIRRYWKKRIPRRNYRNRRRYQKGKIKKVYVKRRRRSRIAYKSPGIYKELNQEVKWLTVTDTFLGEDTDKSGIYYLLNNVSSGTTNHGRVGEKIVVKSLNLKIKLEKHDNDSRAETRLRLIVFIQKNPQGSGPNLGNILYNPTTLDLNIISPYNKDTISEYKILHDKLYSLGRQDSTIMNGMLPKVRFIKIYKELNLLTDFNHTIPTVGEHYRRGTLGMYMISDSEDNYGPQLKIYSRITYTDS